MRRGGKGVQKVKGRTGHPRSAQVTATGAPLLPPPPPLLKPLHPLGPLRIPYPGASSVYVTDAARVSCSSSSTEMVTFSRRPPREGAAKRFGGGGESESEFESESLA